MRARTAALAAIIALAPMGVASAQQRPDTTARQAPVFASDSAREAPGRDTVRGLRDPRTAVVLGLVFPGAGLAYAGRWWQGGATAVATAGGITLGGLALVINKCTFDWTGQCDPGPTWRQNVLGFVILGGTLWGWIDSARRAGKLVEQDNARRRAASHESTDVHPIVIAPTRSNEPWRAGVRAAW